MKEQEILEHLKNHDPNDQAFWREVLELCSDKYNLTMEIFWEVNGLDSLGQSDLLKFIRKRGIQDKIDIVK